MRNAFQQQGELGQEVDFGPQLTPKAYYVSPNEGRKELTERDHRRNEGVDRLFASVRPGVPIDADPTEMRTEAMALSVCMEKLLARLGVGDSPWVTELANRWPEVVGAEVAALCRPGKWDSTRRILYLYVDNATTLFELRRSKLRIVERKIRAFAPEHGIVAVRFMQQA